MSGDTTEAPLSEFDELVQFAKPYARKCCDCEAVAQSIAQWCDKSGEPALFITTVKDVANQQRFPVALSFFHMDPATRRSVHINTISVERPDYTDNEFGFKGNHLVVALLREVQGLIREKVRLPVETFTGQAAWNTFCQGPGYFALKEQRALDYAIPEDDAEPAAPKKKRAL